MLTDVPTHGLVPQSSIHIPNADNYGNRHPQILTPEAANGKPFLKEVNLFPSSFNPAATASTEKKPAQQLYLAHTIFF